MGNSAQTGLNTANDHGHISKCFFAALGVNQCRAVGPQATFATRRISVVAARLAIRRVVVDHRVHVPCRDTKEQGGSTQYRKSVGALPVGLGDDAHAKTLSLQGSANHRHAKTGVVDISVATHDDDIATVPSQGVHFRTASR